ncbi:hypothetical protein IFM89_002488 [Coptis chinensis]|uniref:TF-B3 domain-containing protein n=1 Tax=Coptis chinensis TaxID=261450 RepID=A0A835HIP6_9MAGN|nr:hypothetical protein IFM89_002488 [Coptis chinensis]
MCSGLDSSSINTQLWGSSLHIPTEFVKAHLPKYKTEYVVTDWRGKAWIMKYTYGLTSAFCGGWTAFAVEHQLKEGDTCLFELTGIERLMCDEEDDLKPQFCKIIHASHNTTQHLQIPPNFLEHISKEQTGSANLEGPSGKIWCVRLCKREDGTFLKNGWQDFVKDHSLGNFEFLVFIYEGNMCFKVQIFDMTGCEVVDGFQEPALSGGRRKQGRPPKKVFAVPRRGRGRPPSHQQGRSKAHITDRGKEAVALERCSTKDIGSASIRKNCSSSWIVPTEKESPNWKAAMSFTSIHPSFIRCLTKSNLRPSFILHVPAEFAKAHLPVDKTEFVVKDWGGKAWIMKYTCGHTAAFCGGWTAFVVEHQLIEGDICLFELTDEKEMRAHLFPINPTS